MRGSIRLRWVGLHAAARASCSRQTPVRRPELGALRRPRCASPAKISTAVWRHRLANYFSVESARAPLPARNVAKIWPKANTPDAVTWPDTPKRFLSTPNASRCTTLICSDVSTPRINPQVLHTPLNIGVDGYAHTMHSFINSTPLEYSPATFTVVPARGNAGVWGGGVGALTYALNVGCRMYVRMLVRGGECPWRS